MLKGFVNGRIYASFEPLVVKDAMIVADGRVLKLGSNEEIKALCVQMGAKVEDLKGHTVIPGIIDSHLHMEELGFYLEMADLRGTKSIQELKDRLLEHAESSNGSWILGHGWDQELFEEKRWPSRWDIDEVVKDRPAMLSRVCLHAAVLNTEAMKLTGLMELSLEGVIKQGSEATGIVKEKAFEIAKEKLKESLLPEDYERAIMKADEHLTSLGITAAGSMSVDSPTLRAFSMLNDRGRLKVKVFAYIDPGKRQASSRQMYGNTELLDCLQRLGVRAGFGTKRLRIQGIKILGDGSLGARTAWLSYPYADSSTESGYPNISKELLREIVRRAEEGGLQMSIHGIGDAGIDMALEVYSRLKAPHIRHRIEHTSIIREEQIRKMAELGISAGVQPHFIITDYWTPERVGEKRAKWIYPFRSMADQGVVMGFGTDSPVEPASPWETIYAAVTRGRYKGIRTYALTPKEVLNTKEALQYYTYGSSQLLLAEGEIGSLREGASADFVIVEKDPLKVEERELPDMKVLGTFIQGEKVF